MGKRDLGNILYPKNVNYSPEITLILYFVEMITRLHLRAKEIAFWVWGYTHIPPK